MFLQNRTRRAERLHQLEGCIHKLLAVLIAPLIGPLPARGANPRQPLLVGDGFGLVSLVPVQETGVRDGPEPAERQLGSQL